MRHVDVVIGGGGMVGLPLALALAQGGLKTLVVDAAPPAKVLEPEFDGRVSALAYASVRMLTALGVWEGLRPHAQPIHEILVTDGQAGKPASPFSLHFDAGEVGADSLGHIAENRHIRAALYAAVGACANLELTAPAKVASVTVDAGGAVARLGDGEEISASLVIAADGRDSALRSHMGMQVIGWSYPQTGIVATVEHDKPHNGVAYEHFLPSGPFAILPMPGNRSSLVWTEA
ncbi:MAG TPA: FAD-dependent monooxygenase, partial [Rhizomicrobium sp.]|nr:FAD-dependent monooxygenase [Rhizomicrobium sp.]